MISRRKMIWRLFTPYLLTAILSLAAFTWFASSSIREFHVNQSAADLKSRARLFEEQLAPYLNSPDPEAVDRLTKSAGGISDTRITVILPSGKVVGDSREVPRHMANHADRPEIREALQGRVGRSIRFSSTLLQRMMYVAVPVFEEQGQKVTAVIRTAIPITAIDDALWRFRMKIAGFGLVVAVLAAGISWLISRQYSRPLEEMKKGAARFADGDFDHRLSVPRSEELAGLAEALNQMAAQLDRRIDTIVRQRKELETVLTSMREGVIAVDQKERIVSMNPTAARWFECDPAKAQGRSIPEMIRNLAFQKFVAGALNNRQPQEDDIPVFKNGERVLNVKSSPLLDTDQEQIGTLIMFTDVTPLRRLETMRRDFVANVSHEIKTPLTAIKGFVETLYEGNVEDLEETRRFLGIVKKHVDRLNAVIEDLLSLSRIEQENEQRTLEVRPARLLDVFQAAVQICRPKADEKSIDIHADVDAALAVTCDPTLIEQAVVNLLDNAVKYSESGKSVTLEAGEDGKETFIRVRDQGMGIAQKHLPRLFERFYRVDKARSRDSGGTGLGLAIVKHIAQAHGGRVEVDSELGKGSTFTIFLSLG